MPLLNRTLGKVSRACLLLALCFGALPATAGYYTTDVVSGSGSVTLSPISGSSQTIPLPDANGAWGDPFNGLDGTITYSYTETVEYQWVHEDDYTGPDDPPSSTDIETSVDVGLHFIGSSGGAFSAGNGSATFTVNGNSVDAERISQPNGMGGMTLISDTGGTFTIPVEETISGESGSYTITYSGTVDSGGNWVMGGILEVQRSIPTGSGKYVNITSPKGNDHINSGIAGSVNITFNGWWRCPAGYDTKSMRVRLEAFYSTI